MQLNQGQGSAGNNKLLPELSNLSSWLASPTTDGRTLKNTKGVDAKLTGINCLSFDGSGDRVTVNSINDRDLTVSDTARASDSNPIANLGSCHITTTFMITSSASQVIHSVDAAAYRLFIAGDKFKINNSYNTNIDALLNKVYRSTVEYSNDGGVYKLTIENLTDGTTESIYDENEITGAGTHAGNHGLQIGARSNGLVFNGKILDFRIYNSSVGANIHLPMQEGLGSVCYDISGSGANGTITGASWSTINDAVSHNTLYGFTGGANDEDAYKPAFINKTKQVANFDGVNDFVNFGTHAIPATESVEVVFKPENYVAGNKRGCLYSQGSIFGSYGFSLCTNYQNTTNQNTNTISFRTKGTSQKSINLTQNTLPADGTIYKVTLDYNSSAGTVSISLFNNTTGALIETKSDNSLDATYFNVGVSRPLKIGEDAANEDDYQGQIHSVKSSLIDVDFSTLSNLGTTTVTDNSTNGNNGTITTGSTALFWSRRIVDSNGIIVNADYNTGHFTTDYPSGFVHNESEVGFDLVTTDKTRTEIFAVNNSNATQDFVVQRIPGSSIGQYLQYSSALSDPSASLTRTRTYVG